MAGLRWVAVCKDRSHYFRAARQHRPPNNSRQTPDAALDVQQQTEVSQHLKLLADLIANVAIVGM
jgi:hypothetical protein